LKEAGCRRPSRWMRCCARDGGAGPGGLVALRGRCAGGGRKPPRAAAVKSRGGERRGKSRAFERGRCGSRRRAQAIPLMKRRKQIGDIETRVSFVSWDESGGCLLIGQAVSGVEVARAWSGLSCGTCEPVSRWGGRPVERLWPAAGCLEREPQAAESVRGSVAMRGAGADRLVVAVKPGNAGGAKGTGRPDSVGGQPR
jgi:hypothetical protein